MDPLFSHGVGWAVLLIVVIKALVAFGALLTEGGLWRTALREDAAMVHALGSIPLFRHQADGSLTEDWG